MPALSNRYHTPAVVCCYYSNEIILDHTPCRQAYVLLLSLTVVDVTCSLGESEIQIHI